MKRSFLLVLLIVFLQTVAQAQCSLPVYETRQIHVHDTTFVELTIDTAGYGGGYYCIWHMPDGSNQTGPSGRYPFTEAVGLTQHTPYTIYGPGCSHSDSLDTYVNLVFNCNTLEEYRWDVDEAQQTGPNANDVKLILRNYLTYGDTALKTHMYLDWGNGHITYRQSASDGFNPIGGVDDPAHTSQYQYAGKYRVTGHYYYTYDTMTCPMVYMDTASIVAGGMPSVPMITGTTNYCAGDTLRLSASDTTMPFGNLYHTLSHYYTPVLNSTISYATSPQHFGSNLVYEWFDNNYNRLSNSDTSVMIPNLSVTDAGVYRLHVFDLITLKDTEAVIHINVTGTQLSVDSAVKTSCIAAGNIYLDLHRANDSVNITYMLDGSAHAFSGRTNGTGKLVLPAMVSGKYSNIQARFVGDACASNICYGPYHLPAIVAPIVPPGGFYACGGSSVTLTATGASPGENYFWTGPGGFTSTLQNPVVVAPTMVATDLYQVKINRPGCGLSEPTSVEVHTRDLSRPDLSGAHFIAPCQGQMIFTNPYSSPLSVISSDTLIVNHGRAIVPGTVTLTWIVTNWCGADTLTETVTVQPSPALPDITGSDVVCGNDTVAYSIAVTGGSWGLSFVSDDWIISSTAGSGSSTVRIRLNPSYQGATLTYTKSIGACTSKVSKAILHGVPETYPVFYGSKGLYPGETVTIPPEVPGYAPPVNYYLLNSDTILTQPTPMAVTAGTRNGAALLSHYRGNSCGTDTATTEFFVNDWINTTIAGGGSIPSTLATSAPGRSISFERGLSRISGDAAGNLYFFDGFRIYKQDPNGILTKLAGVTHSPDNPRIVTGENGPASMAGIASVTAMVSDAHGNLYLNCPYNNVIRKISADGTITWFAGTPGIVLSYSMYETPAYYDHSGYTGDGGPATAARINADYLAADDAGNVYFTDAIHNRVRKIDTAGIITTIGGNGVDGYTGDAGPATNAAIGAPQGIAVDKYGNVIVSSKGRLRKIDPSGIINTIAGVTGGAPTAGTTAMTTAPLFNGEVKTDRLGNIFITWYGNVKQIDTAGIVHAITNTFYYDYYTIPFDSFASHSHVALTIQPDDSGNIYTLTGPGVVKMGKPYVEVKPSVDSQCAASAPITFTAMAHNAGDHTSFQWKKNGVNVGTDSRTYYDPAIVSGDTISVQVYLSAGGLQIAKAGKKMTLDSVAPVAPVVSVAGGVLVCVGATASLAASPTGGIWHSTDTTVASLTGNVITGQAAGSAIISYSVSNACGSASDTILATVRTLPDAGTITGTNTMCVPGVTTLTSSASGGTWSSNSAIATVAGGVVTGTAAGTAIISYSITNDCGTSTDTMSIALTAQPVAGTITGNPVLCARSQTTLADTVNGGAWASSSVAATVSNGVVNGVSAGQSIISYTVSNICGTATDTMMVTVLSIPVSGTITGADTVCMGNSITLTENVPGRLWNSATPSVGTITYGGVFTAVHTGSTLINYLVNTTCGFAVATHDVYVKDGDDCNPATGMFDIWPNPTTGSLMVELPKADADAVITIMELSGRVVKSIRPGGNQLTIPVSISELAKGTYIIRVNTTGSNYVQKIVLW